MSNDHPFRQPLLASDLVLRLAGWGDVTRITEIWDHPTLAWMFPNAYDGQWPDPLLVVQMATSYVARENLLVVEDEAGTLLGTVHLNGFDRGQPSLGWYVAPGHRGRDVATRAVGAAAMHLLESHCDQLVAFMDPRNEACRGLMAKLGFAPAPCERHDLVSFATDLAAQVDRIAAEIPALRPAA